MPRRAIFIDRDGTLTRKQAVLPGGVRAIRRINQAGWQAVVVTNQPGCDEHDLAEVHERIRSDLLDGGARLDGIYHCPHPATQGCRCRKPGIALLERARDEMGIDLTGSFFVGDEAADLLAAQTAGVASILVRTGHGAETAKRLDQLAVAPAFIAETLEDAVAWALEYNVVEAGAR